MEKVIEVIMVGEDGIHHGYLTEGSRLSPPAGYEILGVHYMSPERIVINLRKLH